MKTRIMASAAFACAIAAGTAHAQSAGDNIISAGWLHIITADSSKPMTTQVTQYPLTSLAVPAHFTSPGTGASVSNADTAALVLTHFFTDHLAVQSVAGVPPTFSLSGHGVIAPPGIAGALSSIDIGAAKSNPIVGSVRQWSPTVLLQYYFGAAQSRFRPFLSAGVSYTFFTDIQLNPNFESALNQNFGTVLAALALKPGATSVEAKASPSWQPVINAGFSYAFDKHWVANASVSYLPLKTTANIKIKAADGSVLASSDADIKINPIVTFVSIGYRF